ncbi:MAG: hypothetical protein KDH89_16445 [Anaerolineae bacterium]|nr:hypothetical protein [Anaerolineae bacterium]
MSFALNNGQLPVPGLGAIANWPWSLVKLMQLQQQIKYAFEMAGIKKSPVPPNDLILSRYWTDWYIEQYREKKDGNA